MEQPSAALVPIPAGLTKPAPSPRWFFDGDGLTVPRKTASALLRRLVMQQCLLLNSAARMAARYLEKHKVTWNSAPMAQWQEIFNARSNAKLFFRLLREALDPKAYRTALAAAKADLNELNAPKIADAMI